VAAPGKQKQQQQQRQKMPPMINKVSLKKVSEVSFPLSSSPVPPVVDEELVALELELVLVTGPLVLVL